MNYKVLKFGATWCGPCKKLAEDLKKNPINFSNVSIESINVDDNDEMVEFYGIMSLPVSIIVNDHNEEMCRLVGYSGYQNYINWIKLHTQND
jgi:thioredoxin 1